MRKIVCLASLILVLVMITGLIDRANRQAVGPVQAALHGKGRIRLVYHAANFFATGPHYEAFESRSRHWNPG
jgi:hypothetical protein